MKNLRQLLLTVSAAIAILGFLAVLPCHAVPIQAENITPEGTSWLMLSSGAAPLAALWMLRRRRANS